MSFKQNDNNENTIHLGNYEEFFVLYMDNELSDAQMKMVDDFLAANPDLEAEFHILMSTKLPAEDLTFNKEDLFADSMKGNTVGEDLFLYIDNELPAGQKRIVEVELASNEEYSLQHQLLLKTKLDAAETIVYPNKEELYRRTERRIAFKPWMRVAAAAIVIAAMGVVYFNSSPDQAAVPGTTASGTNTPAVKTDNRPSIVPVETPKNDIAITTEVKTGAEQGSKKAVTREQSAVKLAEDNKVNDMIQKGNDDVIAKNGVPDAQVQKAVGETPVEIQTVASINIPNRDFNEGFINNRDVTSSVIDSYNKTKAAPVESATAGTEGKGSVKGFLRKATRMIEKRTGIDATNDDGKLLIGAVALRLK